MYPPNIVQICDDARGALYICIPENTRTVKIDDNTNDTPLLTAEGQERNTLFKLLFFKEINLNWKNRYQGAYEQLVSIYCFS